MWLVEPLRLAIAHVRDAVERANDAAQSLALDDRATAEELVRIVHSLTASERRLHDLLERLSGGNR